MLRMTELSRLAFRPFRTSFSPTSGVVFFRFAALGFFAAVLVFVVVELAALAAVFFVATELAALGALSCISIGCA